MVFANWNVPVGVDYCNARGQAVSCNFNNPTPLQPDYNIVGKSVSFPTTVKNSLVMPFTDLADN
jgi:hypothetical protein